MSFRSVQLEHVYRAAMEVHWDSGGFLYSPPPREWSRARWLQLFRAAVRMEYGRELVVTRDTIWRGIDAGLQTDLARALLGDMVTNDH